MVSNTVNNSGIKVNYIDKVNIKGSRGRIGGGPPSHERSVGHGICADKELFLPSDWGVAHARGCAMMQSVEPVCAAGAERRGDYKATFFLRGGASIGAVAGVTGGGGDVAALNFPGHAAAAQVGSLEPASQLRICCRRLLRQCSCAMGVRFAKSR
jgi:hypothetical protein